MFNTGKEVSDVPAIQESPVFVHFVFMERERPELFLAREVHAQAPAKPAEIRRQTPQSTLCLC